MPVDDARIGDFSQPVIPQAGVQRSPVKDALDSAEKRLDADASRDEAALKPLASYDAQLAAINVTKDQAAEIIDAVLLKGHYSEDINITKSIKARFRTRGARDTRRAQELLETMRLTYERHYSEMLGRFLLASSLEMFGGDRLEYPTRTAKPEDVEKMFTTRMAYVESLSEPALRILFDKLRAFDEKILTVLDGSAIENF